MANHQGIYTITTRFQIKVNGNVINNFSINEETRDNEVEIIQPFDEVVDIVEVPLQFSTNLSLVVLSGILFVHAADAPNEIDALCLPIQHLHNHLNSVQTYIQRVLYSCNVTQTASNAIAAHVVSFLLRQNTHVNFNAFIVVDNIRGYTVMPLPPTIESPLKTTDVLEKNEEEPDSKVCSICLDQICQNMEAIEISCGHVYHGSCILTWLDKSNSCPLCRRPALL